MGNRGQGHTGGQKTRLDGESRFHLHPSWWTPTQVPMSRRRTRPLLRAHPVPIARSRVRLATHEQPSLLKMLRFGRQSSSPKGDFSKITEALRRDAAAKSPQVLHEPRPACKLFSQKDLGNSWANQDLGQVCIASSTKRPPPRTSRGGGIDSQRNLCNSVD